MSRDLATLDAEALPIFQELIARIKAVGIEPLVVFTRREPVEQAALWRQSRSAWVVDRKIKKLLTGSLFQKRQAYCLIKAGAQSGAWATDALPYESAHQFGCAIDLCPLLDGKAAWERIDLFMRMGAIGKGLGLMWGGEWRGKRDWGHFELRHWLYIAEMQLFG